MNALRILSSQPWVARLGWTLVHFLWQGSAIAALYAAARLRARHASPDRRYLLACVALTAMLAAPVATYRLSASPEPVAPIFARTAPPARISDSGTTFLRTSAETASTTEPFAAVWSERVLPSLVLLWCAGAFICCARLTVAWLAAARLRARHADAAPTEWQQAFERLKQRLRVRRPVRLLLSRLVEVPVVVGWLRPAILVPAGVLAGLPAEHLEALLLHELAHIRRHDYLVNVLQSVVEALLFYHPAVWWISGHLRAERELCCDDLAVAATGDAFAYATALADLEAFRPAPARAVLAANGGWLAGRIARVLGRTRPEMPAFSGPGAAGAILLAIASCVLFAQPAARPKFEVASVKPTPEKLLNYSELRALPGGHLRVKNVTLSGLIGSAYHLQVFQIAGGPDWMQNEGFDIDAKADTDAKRAELLLLLQPLLEERFQLKFHRETRDVPVYALTVARGGARLPPPKEGGCTPSGNLTSIPCGGLNMLSVPPGIRTRGGDVAMPELIRTLSTILGKPVLDRTGIAAHFDVDLTFTPDESAEGLMTAYGSVAGHRESMAASASAANDPSAPPTIFSAVQQQLGLKLESTKGPAEVMVIDHVEKPSAN